MIFFWIKTKSTVKAQSLKIIGQFLRICSVNKQHTWIRSLVLLTLDSQTTCVLVILAVSHAKYTESQSSTGFQNRRMSMKLKEGKDLIS